MPFLNNFRMSDIGNFLGIHMSETLLSMRRFLGSEFEKSLPKLSFEDWMMLAPIAKKKGISQKELSENIARDKTIVSRLVDLWVKKGWIKRESQTEDKRKNGLFFTKKGKELWEKGIPLVSAADEVFTRNLNNEEQKEIYLLLFKIQSSINITKVQVDE